MTFRSFRFFLERAPQLAWQIASIRSAGADRRRLRDPIIGRQLVRSSIDGLSAGVIGPVTDMAIFSRTWDVEPESVRCEARLWLGGSDRNVPRSAARALASRLPKCDLVEIANEGHFWVTENYEAVFEWLGLAGSMRGAC